MHKPTALNNIVELDGEIWAMQDRLDTQLVALAKECEEDNANVAEALNAFLEIVEWNDTCTPGEEMPLNHTRGWLMEELRGVIL